MFIKNAKIAIDLPDLRIYSCAFHFYSYWKYKLKLCELESCSLGKDLLQKLSLYHISSESVIFLEIYYKSYEYQL